ncbi:class I SAM-dependent methyltransferase [Bradyrhizobium sp. CCGUVB23]|nr:class I SAM-dependent methyltransferase [Bradyrhizobium sp. CCGUVB23]
MRVLDVGSGTGDVAFLAGELVGDAGEVIGADHVATAVGVATQRAMAKGMRNVSFRVGDPSELEFGRPFDAVVGRYVLVLQAAAAAMVRKLAKHLSPGGVIVFHEPDWSCVRSFPPAPTYDACCRWAVEAFRRAGTDQNGTITLYVRSWTPICRRRRCACSFIGFGAACADWLTVAADLERTLLPKIEQFGLATEAEVDVATLAQRLRDEVTASSSLIVGRSEIAAWSRL